MKAGLRNIVGHFIFLVLLLIAARQPAVCQAQPSLEGETLFQQQCAGCHGDKGQGAACPNIQGIHDVDIPLTAMALGAGKMPDFTKQLSSEQMVAIAHYVTEKLGVLQQSPNGKAIFVAHCARCHGADGQGISSPISVAGPNIQAVHDPSAPMMAMEVGPGHMPSFAKVLSVPEMRVVAQYVADKLAVIPMEEGDIGQGGELFRQYCAACHRTGGRGGAMVFTGVNAPDLADKSLPIIAGAIRWGPGPMPAFPKSVLDDKQLASIVTYIQFVKSPPNPGGETLHWIGPVAEGFVAWVIMLAIVVLTTWIEKGGKG
jgi:ubiquinol-cytochrome c reductase cytochrome c subunit